MTFQEQITFEMAHMSIILNSCIEQEFEVLIWGPTGATDHQSRPILPQLHSVST